MPNPRKVEDVERQLESVSKALKEREKKYVCYFYRYFWNADLMGDCVDRVPRLRRWCKRLIRRKEILKRWKRSSSRCLL